MLGVGDFYYELGVQIIEVCLALKHRNGGMRLSVNQLLINVVDHISDRSNNPCLTGIFTIIINDQQQHLEQPLFSPSA